MAPSWRLAFLRSAQSTSGQSGGEVIGAYAARLCARECDTIRRPSNKRLAPFLLHFAVPFLGSKSGPKTGPTK